MMMKTSSYRNLLLLLILAASFPSYAVVGSQRITLKQENIDLETFFTEIREQTGYDFIYNSRHLKRTRSINVDVRNSPLKEVLSAAFKDQPLDYSIIDRTIVIKRKRRPRVPPQPIDKEEKAAQAEISGKVTDEGGAALPGVSISLKGTTTGTVTDLAGQFSIAVPGPESVLVFSLIGFASQEVTVGAQTSLQVVMKVDQQRLEEVVVVGYGTQRREDLTGSVSSIRSEDLARIPMTSFDQGIQGMAAGVQVTQSSSAPGGRVSIRVRGGNSLSSGNEPLYVVDGYPITAGATAGGQGAGQNPLASINPSDIASIDILKDASATAIYGSRGANGVVLITTKRGKAGETIVSYNGYYGTQAVANKLDMMNASQFAELVNEARMNDGIATPAYPNPLDPHYFPDPSAFGEGVDYQDEIFRNAAIQNHSINISGGNERSRFAVSGSYFDQDGVVIGSDFQRASVRANIDTRIGERFSFKANLSGSRVWGNNGKSEGDGGGNGRIINSALTMPPTVPIFQADGVTYTRTNPTPGGSTVHNPVPIGLFALDKQTVDRFLGMVEGRYDITDHLSLKVSLGSDMSTAGREVYDPRQTVAGFNANGRAERQSRKSSSYLNENLLTYTNLIDRHSINAIVGYTWQINKDESFSASASNFLTDQYHADNLGAGANYTNPDSWKNQSQLVSWLGRINYVFDDRYLLSLTGRADGSSKFGENNKWAFFPSVAFGWNVHNESFMPELGPVNTMKLRLSYGITGNQNISNYRSLARLNVYNYNLNGNLVSGLAPGNIPNPDLKWETTSTANIGLDLGLFDSQMNFTAEYYHKKTTDLLWNISTPITSGFSSVFRNIGSLENKGIELSLGGDILQSQFQWNTQINWSANRNKVLEIPGYTPSTQGSISGHLKVSGSWLEPGLPVGVWKLLKYDGVFQDEAQLAAGPSSSANDKLGDARFIDKDGDGSINLAEDRMIVGDPNPDFIYGWSNNFSFKRFDLSIYIQGTQGNDVMNVQRAETNVSGPWGNQRTEILDRWTPDNTNTDIPRARVTVDPLLVQSSWIIEDGSYLRVKTATLGYTLQPEKYFSSIRVYLTAQNLLTLTNYTGYDPEVNSPGNSNLQLGVDYNAYPSVRAFMIGVNASF